LIDLRIGFGGGCHWCTEAVFQSLQGVSKVEQGFIKSFFPQDTFSEAVIVTFDPQAIPLDVLIDVHLRTHASTSAHRMREKYRSAVYVFSDAQGVAVQHHLNEVQAEFDAPLVTTTLAFDGFKSSSQQFQDYYRSNKDKPFCKTHIDPKLKITRQKFGRYYDS
jgi:peptide-methionine (S)-S-oxide reductase